jgi:hypothetical protein
MSRPSHLCICQYIQHPLPSLVERSIPSSRCGHVWMSSFHYSSHRVLGPLLIISLVCSLCWYSFLINQHEKINKMSTQNYRSLISKIYGGHGLAARSPQCFAPPAIWRNKPWEGPA